MQNAGYLRVHKAAGWSRAHGKFRSVTRFSLHLLYFGSTVNEWSYRNVPVLKDSALVSLQTRSKIYSDMQSLWVAWTICADCVWATNVLLCSDPMIVPRSAYHPFAYLHHMLVMPSVAMCLLTRSEEFCNILWSHMIGFESLYVHKNMNSVIESLLVRHVPTQNRNCWLFELVGTFDWSPWVKNKT